MAKYTFIRNSDNPNRKAVEEDNEYTIRGCFAFCSEQVRARLEAFFTDRKQESVKFEFDNGETVEVWRDV